MVEVVFNPTDIVRPTPQAPVTPKTLQQIIDERLLSLGVISSLPAPITETATDGLIDGN